jgi:inner membrane transporter RhtA
VGVRRGNALPAGLVLAGAVSVQTGAGVANHLFSQIPPASVTTLRLWAGALVLLIIAGRPTARALADVRRRRAWSDALVTAAFGVTLGFMNFAIYQAFARIPLGIAVTIEFLGPLTVTVVGALVGSATARSRALALGCAGLAALGVVMLANGVVGHLNWAGVAWAVGAAFAWACYIIGSKATGQRMPGSSGLVVAMCVAAIAVTIPGVVQGGSPDLLATGAAIGVLSSVIPYWLEMEALRRISTQLFGVWMSLQPAVAALIGLALLSQRLSPAEWIGICCVVIASAAASRRPAAPPTPSEALGARAIPPRSSAHRVMVRGRDATGSARSPEPPEPNASAAGAVNGALRWCACFPVLPTPCYARRCGRCTAGRWRR